MRNIRAVARNTIAQAVRMKVAAAVILLLLILLPIMSMVMSGDGTLLGKLQSFSSYGISLVGLLLSILAISISCYSLSSDLKRRQLDLVITKPIRRRQIVLGKFIGTALLNLALLCIFAAIVYGLTLLIPVLQKASPAERARAATEFFTARKIIKPQFDEELLQKAVMQRYEELRKTDQLPPEMSASQVIGTLRAQADMGVKSVMVSSARDWEFRGVRVPDDPNSLIFVRFKFEASPEPADGKVYGHWEVGDFRQFQAGPGQLKTPIYTKVRSDSVRDVHEFEIRADAVGKDGIVHVGFFNSPEMNYSTVMFDEIELLYRAGGFELNFIRVVLLMAIRLVFLSALGVSLSTWLSFPVAALVSYVVFAVGMVNGFLLEAVESLGAVMGLIYSMSIKPFLQLVPRFDGAYSPTDYIVSGQLLPWLFLAKAAALTIVLQATLLIAIAIWIFHRREIAKVTV